MSDAAFTAWLDSLAPEQRASAGMMHAGFRSMGAPPEDCDVLTQSDLTEQNPAFAAYSLLHAIWQKIDAWRDDTAEIERIARVGAFERNEAFSDADEAVARMVSAGADVADLAVFARSVAYAVSFDVLHLLDEGAHPRRDDPIGWSLVEDDPARPGPARPITYLHEAVLGMDPSGREGRPA